MYFLKLDILKHKPIEDTSISVNDTTQSNVVDLILSSIYCKSSSFNFLSLKNQLRRKTEVIVELDNS